MQSTNKTEQQGGEHNLPVRFLKKVGPVTGARLEKNGLKNLLDLLCFLPSRYIDPAWVTPLNRIDLSNLQAGTNIHVLGKVQHASECFSTKLGKSWFEVHFEGSQELVAKWTNYSLKELEAYVRINQWAIVSGAFDGHSMQNATIVPLGSDNPWPLSKRSCTLYPVLEGFSYDYMRNMLASVVARYRHRLDFCVDREQLEREDLLLPSTSFEMLHLDWPCQHINLLNQGETPAHQTVRYLRKHLQSDN